MYRYIERETYEGKRYHAGHTSRSEKSLKFLPNVGKPIYVRGYVVKSTRGTGDDEFSTTHIHVLVRGENGTIRFGGMNWGYGGTGPRCLNELFKLLGIADKFDVGEDLGNDYESIGEHWYIRLDGPQPILCQHDPVTSEARKNIRWVA